MVPNAGGAAGASGGTAVGGNNAGGGSGNSAAGSDRVEAETAPAEGVEAPPPVATRRVELVMAALGWEARARREPATRVMPRR